MRSFILTALCAAMLLVPSFSHAAPDVATVTASVQEAYDSLTGFRTLFTQYLKNKASGEVETREGEFLFQKPNLVRWDTASPESELLIVGPDVVWDYFADEEVAYRYPVETILNSKTMLRFISGTANLSEDFYVDLEGEEDGLLKLSLVPKEPEAQLVQAYIWVEEGTWLIGRIMIIDFGANENLLEFTDMELDPELDESLFQFSPPEDVDVFDNTQE